jgi:hypothetical protein
VKNPHVSHLLDSTHASHDPHAVSKGTPKTLKDMSHHDDALAHGHHHKSAMAMHSSFDDSEQHQCHSRHPRHKAKAKAFGSGPIAGNYL